MPRPAPFLPGLLMAAALGLAPAGPARAWDDIGHMLIDQVAVEHLQPGVKEKLAALAAQIVFPGSVYDPVTLGCWMDDIRTTRPDVPFHGRFKSWHYIDLGLNPGDPMPSMAVIDPMDERAGNVVQALERSVGVMKGGIDPLIPNRAVAVAMIAHLVGDIHQPLHCSTYYFPGANSWGRREDDRGGNEVAIVDSEPQPDRMGPRPLNLHAFWDGAYRAGFQNGEVALAPAPRGWQHEDSDADAYGFDPAAYAPAQGVSLAPNFPAWALESNQLARDDIYSALSFADGHRTVRLSDDDVQKAKSLARQRLVLAGLRLAQLLNELLSGTSGP